MDEDEDDVWDQPRGTATSNDSIDNLDAHSPSVPSPRELSGSDHDPQRVNSSIVAPSMTREEDVEYMMEDMEDGANTPYVPISPLSMGRGDRYSMLNVHYPAADLVSRTYSRLSFRGGEAGAPAPIMSVPSSFVPESPTRRPSTYVQRLRSALVKPRYMANAAYPIAIGWDIVPTFLLCFATLIILSVIDVYLIKAHISLDLNSFLPSFGSTAAILFGLPKSPFAQPRSLFGGHAIGAILGVTLAQATRAIIVVQPLSNLIAGVLAVSLTIGLMMTFNIMHPSACATAFSASSAVFLDAPNDRGYLFIVTPVLVGCIVLFLVAWLGNNLFAARAPYPMYW